MNIQKLIKKSDDIQMAIESLDVLSVEHNFEEVNVFIVFLKEQKTKVAKEISTAQFDINVQYEQITRLSHF